MNAEQFLTVATSPAAWFTKSAALRRSADVLWDTFFDAILNWASQFKVNPLHAKTSEEEALEYLGASKFLYGLALETAFKGHILQQRPSDIEFRMSADGTGTVQTVEVKSFGVALGQAHNVELLAERAGVFAQGEKQLFKEDSDYRALREILRHLSEIVYWSGRYPVPLRSGDTHQVPPDVPAKVFGHFMRDWIDPVLDRYQGAFWNPGSITSAARLIGMVQRFERLKDESGVIHDSPAGT